MTNPAAGKNAIQYRRFRPFHSVAGTGITVYIDSVIRKDCKIFKKYSSLTAAEKTPAFFADPVRVSGLLLIALLGFASRDFRSISG